METPKEFNKTATVTIGLLIWISGISFSMGMIYKSIIDNEREHEQLKEYARQEIEGLRSDWERDRREQNRRLIKLEK